MKKVLLSIMSLAILPVVFVACNKDDDNNNNQKTKTQLITQSSWKFQSATANSIDISNQDPPFSACRKDNIITFATGGTGTVSEGATSCTPAENATFTWNFTNNETGLHMSAALFPNAPTDFTIVSLTETELKVSFPYTISSVTVTVIATFIH
jgi:hypothetical protein